MKKFLSIIMVALLAVSMTACETGSTGGDDSSSQGGVKRGAVVSSQVESETSEVESAPAESSEAESEPESDTDSDTESKTASEKDSDASSKTESTASKADLKLSDDLYDYTVEIDGTVYQFPMKTSDFIKLGWELDGQEYLADGIPSGSYYTEYFENKNDASAIFYLTNFAKSTVEWQDSYIGGVTIYASDIGGEDGLKSVTLPKGIDFNKATVEDIKKAYGEPSDTYEDSDSDYIKLTYGEYQECYEFTFSEGVLNNLDISNLIAPDDFEEPELRDEIPEFITAYEQPKKLGEDMQSGTIELDGVLYQFPIPVDELLKNGWEIEDEEEVATLGSGASTYITLEKGNKTLDYVTVYNDAEYEVPIEYARVKRLSIAPYSVSSIDFKFPGNVTLSTKLDAFEKAVKDMDYITDEGDGYIVYTFEVNPNNDDYVYDQIDFQYSTEDDKELIHIDIDFTDQE